MYQSALHEPLTKMVQSHHCYKADHMHLYVKTNLKTQQMCGFECR